MKDIIAKLEERRASRRRWAEAFWRATASFLVVGVLASAVAAHAQSGRWRGPANIYTVDASAWVFHEERNPPIVARFTLADAPPGPPQMQCFIVHRLYWDQAMTRSQANSDLRSRIPSTDARNHISDVREETVNGVLVISYQNEFGNVLARYRMFLRPSARGEDYHEISCGGSKPLSSQQLANIDAFLSSLSIESTP